MKQVDRRAGDILVVDDDYWMNSFICHWLSGLFPRHGFQSARNGPEALGMTGDVPFALALLDIEMPEMNGYALARELRARQPDLPVVMLSLNDTPEHRAAAVEVGASAYVTKTDMFVELPGFMRQLLSDRQRNSPQFVPVRLVEDNG